MWKELNLRIKGEGQVLDLALVIYGTEQTNFF